MASLIESLESRVLLSGTPAATLSAAAALVSSDGAAVTADLDELGTLNAQHDEAIGSALAGRETKADEKILKVLKSDADKAKKVYSKADTSLNETADALANKSVIAGDAVLLSISKRNIAKVKIDIAALEKVTKKPLASLDAELASQTIHKEFEVLRAANPSNTALSAAITAREDGADTQKTVIGNAAVKFHADVAALAAELADIITA
jgi:hypothetical protein